jgi:GTP cyclohydrolase I
MSNTKEPDLEPLIRDLLLGLGEDPDRQGLRRTPGRVAGALRFLTSGYRLSLEQVVGEGVFEEQHEEMILVRDIELYSLCEHHLLPFYGRAHVAYIPNGRLLGLSKVPRLVEVFARRLQIQERLTDQIADAVMEVLHPQGVGVVIDAAHLCMMMRGVEKQNSRTVTSAVRGLFRSDPKTRAEFLQLVHGSRSLE